MILWLDHLIFGNGRGLSTPYFDGRFFWLSGRLYTFSAGLGAQLHSIQWTHPKAGERRRISGREYRPLHSARSWCRVRVAWSTPLGDDPLTTLRDIEGGLGRLVTDAEAK